MNGAAAHDAQAEGAGDWASMCQKCGRQFGSYAGRRHHERLAHAEEYHQEELHRLITAPKQRWAQEEVDLMAAFERAHPRVAFINEAIRREVLPHRSIEGIKGKRRHPTYKSLVRGEVNSQPSSGEPAPPPPPGNRAPGRRPSALQSTLNQMPPLVEDEAEGTPTVMVPPQLQPDSAAALDRAVRELSEGLGVEVPMTVDQIQGQLDEWSPPPLAFGRPPSAGEQARRQPRNNRERRRQEYALFQRAWKKDRGRAARRVAAGQSYLEGVEEKPQGTNDFWKALYQRPSPAEVPTQPIPGKPLVGEYLMAPVAEDEVQAALKATKGDTAPGPDGRKKAALVALGTEKLRWLMNAALRLGDLPSSWVQGRTVLLPKKEKPQNPADFRPLTITPVLTRTLHRVLARRLATLAPLPLSQKGFRKEEGCAANLLLVQQALRQAKAGPKSLYMAFIDFKKAFDSVGHPAIAQACVRWGLGERFAKYVANVYRQANTGIDGAPVKISRGVMQGDPMSPALFNMTLDGALSALPKEVGVEIGGTKFQYLAFADDVVLLASTSVGLRRTVDALTSASDSLGLEIGVAKCATLGIRADGKRKTWVQDSIKLRVNDQPIRALAPGKFYKYLGVGVGTSWAEGPSHMLARYISGLGRLQRCPAKPQQKLWALTSVLIPQLTYPLLHSYANKGTLKRVDRESRKFVRAALHLPHDTPLGLFHAAVVDGGLGVTSMETRIPRLREDLLTRLRQSHDPAVRVVAGEVAAPAVDSVSSRRKQEKRHWQDSLYKAVDGKGLEGIADTPISSSWISDGTTLMKGGDYVKAVKLRGNLLPTRLRAARGRQQPDILCDLCYGRRVESLGHIQQQCPAVAGPRTSRHNRLLDKYVTVLQHKGYQVKKEQAIPTPAGLRYPDIICWKDDRATVIDVQVVADAAAGSLQNAHQRKVDYYNVPAVRDFVALLTGSPPVFTTFTISWRGVLAPASMNTWTSLGLPKTQLKLMVVKTLEGGLVISRDHKNTSGTRVPRAGPEVFAP